jgi:predicted membrane protein
MTFPLSFKEFITDPIKATLFLALIAIMYLYIDNKLVYKEQIEKQEARIILLESKVDLLQEKIIGLVTAHGHEQTH